jgi:N-methylhydantoinase A
MSALSPLLRPRGTSGGLGVDAGGTFTDFVAEIGGRLICFKIPSTPRQPERAFLAGAALLGGTPRRIAHGTTVATNALLERRGAPTALVTTRGFEDLIVIGRQARPSLYDIDVARPAPLVPEGLRLGVRERTSAGGRVLERPRLTDLRRCAARLRRSRARSVAVCFLHSYAAPGNERAAARFLRLSLGRRRAPHLCTSSGILPEHREFERFSTAVLSAYLTPVLADYLRRLARRLRPARVQVLRSDGTSLPAPAAAREAAHSLLSGPAAGAVACLELGRRLGQRRLLGFDMGGTSTDVTLIDGNLPVRRSWQVGGWPVALPSLAIETVGAGGGSIARVDEGGALRVGPGSAGADPGPVAWGRGEELTVTDAHLYLGRIDPDAFARQGIRLHPRRVPPRLRRLARRLRLTPERAAEGIVEIAESQMERALRRISIEQGHDPRRFALVAFGGAGGLHAVALARRLGCRLVLVPPSPGTFSALGLLLSRPSVERSATVLGRAASSADAVPILRRLEREALQALARDAGSAAGAQLERRASLRYRGQSHEIEVPFSMRLERRFHQEHRRRFGIADPGRPLEWVALRVRASAPRPRLRSLAPLPLAGEKRPAPRRLSRAFWDGRWRPTLLIDRLALRPGRAVRGPALILEYGATTALPPGASAVAGAGGVLRVKP